MALRIGKKKAADVPATIPAETTETYVADSASVPISNAPDDFDDFSNIPADDSTALPYPSEPFDDTTDTTMPAPPRAKKAPPKALLGALGALLLVGIGAGAYTMLQPPAEPEVPPAPIARKARPKAVAPAPAPVKPKVAAKAPAGKLPGKVMPPPKAAMIPKTAKPATPAPPPAAAPAAPLVTSPPPRVVANPGVLADDQPVIVQTPGSAGLKASDSPLYGRLKSLWKQGADAKHRNDNRAARRAWQAGLQLASSSPKTAKSAQGFRDSLAKLPK